MAGVVGEQVRAGEHGGGLALDVHQRRDELADMHLATPARALMMARALGVLPAETLLVGVQTSDTDRLGQELSGHARRAVGVAVDELRKLLTARPAG